MNGCVSLELLMFRVSMMFASASKAVSSARRGSPVRSRTVTVIPGLVERWKRPSGSVGLNVVVGTWKICMSSKYAVALTSSSESSCELSWLWFGCWSGCRNSISSSMNCACRLGGKTIWSSDHVPSELMRLLATSLD